MAARDRRRNAPRDRPGREAPTPESPPVLAAVRAAADLLDLAVDDPSLAVDIVVEVLFDILNPILERAA